MGHLPFTVLAYFLNSIAVLIDKYQLSKNLPSPLLYVFYISAFSLLTLVALPFTTIPSLSVFLFASFATLFWTSGAYCMFSALKVGQATRVIPVIGVLTPLFLLIWGLFSGVLNETQVWGIILLVFGLLFLVVKDLGGKLTKKEALFEIGAALFFAISYSLLHEAYTHSSFLTVFVWAKLILIPVGIFILLYPRSRAIVLAKDHKDRHQKPLWRSKVGLLFLFGQACGGGSEMLLSYSISIATPALVNSLQGIQYASLFLFGLLLSKRFPKVYGEKYTARIIILKILGILIIALGLFFLALSTIPMNNKNGVPIGVTFSPRFARELGLDPKEAFTRSLDETGIKKIRLPVYWDEVERDEDIYNFAENRFYIEEAKKRGVEIILVVGMKQPRWPECFVPDWAENLPREKKYQRVVRLVAKEVSYYRQYDNITHWQVENEPLFHFGLCEKPDAKTVELLKNEIAVVKALDSRPIIITDSGELSSWRSTLFAGDIFGTTMYRSSWNPLIGYIDYPTPAIFYPLKARFIEWIQGKKTQQKIVAELQTEPWAKGTMRIIDMTIEEQIDGMSVEDIRKNVSFAKQTGFSPVYLWGIEWWYWMSLNGHPEYFETVRQLVTELDS